MSTKEPFTVSIPDEVLADLRDRLTRTRWMGIEMRRAQRLGFGGTSTRFQVGLSPTPVAHVSSSLPMIPDGRISRVRFETAARCFSLPRAFLPPRVLKPWSTSPPDATVCLRG